MATVLVVLTSGRRSGFTSRLVQRAADGAALVDGVSVEVVASHDFSFGPCTSCFSCIRDPEGACILDDDMGRRGDGALYRRIRHANALLIGDPVHNWSPSASARLLIERCYPFLWTGKLKGMPSASISCASNQGMQRLAREELCKWLFGLRTRWVGGVAAHLVGFERHRREAHELGRALGEAAAADDGGGRDAWDDEDCYEHYVRHAPWDPLECYLRNLTDGTMRAGASVIARALQEGTVARPRARELLERAEPGLEEALRLYHAGEHVAAARTLARASAYWTRATWLEYLEGDVIGAGQPESYRPLPADEDDAGDAAR